MYCTQCGRPITVHDERCPSCGAISARWEGGASGGAPPREKDDSGIEKIYFCVGCHRIVRKPVDDTKLVTRCRDCKSALVYKGNLNWEALSDAQKAALIGNWASVPPPDPNPGRGGSSGWIAILKVLCYIVFFGSIILGIVIGANTYGGGGAVLVGVLIGAVVGFCLTAFTMVYLEMAEDIREIRNKMK